MFRVILLLTMSAAGMMLLVLILGNRFVFYPSKHPEGFWSPEDLGSRFVDETFHTDDGYELHGWWAPADTSKTLLWLHGNSGNVTHRLGSFRAIHDFGVQIFLFDYRGYGKSEGQPDEEGLNRDALAAYDHLLEQKNLSDDDIYLFGRSLGGAVATKLATEVDCGGVILQSTFTSIKDMAGATMPVPLLYLFLRTRMDSLSHIQQVRSPLLFIHGDQDEIVPVSLGRKLYEHAPEPKKWVEIKGAGHDDLMETDEETYRQSLLSFVHQREPN